MAYYVRIQWAKDATQGGVDLNWVEYVIDGVRDVRGLPRKGEPAGNDVLDLQEGWIAAVEIQGNVEQGWDHMAWDYAGGTLLWGCWNDDPEDWPLGPWGIVRTIGPVIIDSNLLRWDPATGPNPIPQNVWDEAVAEGLIAQNPLDGKWYGRNTDQTVTFYADDATLNAMVAAGPDEQGPLAQAVLDGRVGTEPRRQWSEFPEFHHLNTIHGVWVDDTTALSGDPEDTAWRRHVLARSQPPGWWTQ